MFVEQTRKLVRQLIFTLNWKTEICLLIKSPSWMEQTSQKQDNFWWENAAAHRSKARAGHKQTDKSKMNKTRQLIQNKWAIVVWEKKGQFILVSHWPFKLDLECCWWAEVYQCPCPVGYELIPCWYSWCCEQSYELTPPWQTRSWATAIKAREVEQSAHSLQHQHNTVCPLKNKPLLLSLRLLQLIW